MPLPSRRLPVFFLAGLLALGIAPARAFDAGTATVWADSYLARVQSQALVASLNAALLSAPSATLTLDRWCADHHLAPEGSKIVADRVRGAEKPADETVRSALQAGPDERIAYRRVRLTCGAQVLSEADNWYLPGLLTEAMNTELETTDAAFGRVVRPLGFTRTTLEAVQLWQPLPADWALAAPPAIPAGPLALPEAVIRHKAVLKRADGRPFSLVVETYSRAVLAFPQPPAP